MVKPIHIHPELQKIPAYPVSTNPWMLTATNLAIHFVDAFKWRKFKSITTYQKITGPDGHRIPIWLIKPESATTPGGALIYFHGGAFVMKHAPQHIENAVRYARGANCSVVFVDYRLAFRDPFPAPFDDCYAALVWAYKNASQLGIDPQRIAVGGDSAGGTLAASVAQKAAHEGGIKLCGQLLVYPCVDSDCKTESSKAFVDIPPFKQASVTASWETYLGHSLAAGVPAFASPAHGNLSNLAPAYIETGEYDILHDEGTAYAKALSANGVEVVLNETLGTVHGYDLLAADAKLSHEAIDKRVQFLRRVFHI